MDFFSLQELPPTIDFPFQKRAARGACRRCSDEFGGLPPGAPDGEMDGEAAFNAAVSTQLSQTTFKVTATWLSETKLPPTFNARKTKLVQWQDLVSNFRVFPACSMEKMDQVINHRIWGFSGCLPNQGVLCDLILKVHVMCEFAWNESLESYGSQQFYINGISPVSKTIWRIP